MSEFQNYFPEGRFQGVDCDTGYNDQTSAVQARFLQAVFQPETFRQDVQQFPDFGGRSRNQNESRYNLERASRLENYRRSIRTQNNSFRSDCSSGRCFPDQSQNRGDVNLNYIQSLVRQGVVPSRVLNDYMRETERNPNSYHSLTGREQFSPNSNWDYTRIRSGYQPNDWGNRNNRFVQPDYRTRYYPQHRNEYTQPYYQNSRNNDFGDVLKDVLIASLLGRSSNSWYRNQYQSRHYGDYSDRRYSSHNSSYYQSNLYPRSRYFHQSRGQDIGRTIARIAIPMIINQIGRHGGRGRRGCW